MQVQLHGGKIRGAAEKHYEVLEKRMRSRSTENKELTEQHIQEAKERYEKEITFESHADIVLINDDLEKAKSLTDEVVEAYTKA